LRDPLPDFVDDFDRLEVLLLEDFPLVLDAEEVLFSFLFFFAFFGMVL
jgi:hypothetical protein